MRYELQFHPDALDEWGRLDKAVWEQLKKKLAQRLDEPIVPASRLAGRPNRYKIKFRHPDPVTNNQQDTSATRRLS